MSRTCILIDNSPLREETVFKYLFLHYCNYRIIQKNKRYISMSYFFKHINPTEDQIRKKHKIEN